MSKAIIATGGHQYIVAVGDTINVELVDVEEGTKQISFEPLMIIDGEKSSVGTAVGGVKVTADILDGIRADKVMSIRYKAKKRVHKVRGHRQQLSQLKITKIA